MKGARLFRIIINGKVVWRFLFGAILSFAFSIAVILSTIGLMDGFELTLREALQKSSGEILIYKQDSMMSYDVAKKQLADKKVDFTPILQVEAFALAEELSRGVLIKGIEADSFNNVSGLNVLNFESGVTIGKTLAKELFLKEGDEILLAFSAPQSKELESTIIHHFPVKQIVSHGVHEQDLRFIYMEINELREIMGYKSTTVNMIYANRADLTLDLDTFLFRLNTELDEEFMAKAYWSSFETLINAVAVEKFSISLILQLIVVIALFNVLAFMIFITEKKTQEFFMLRTLGLNLKQLSFFWVKVFTMIWVFSCAMSLGLTWLVDNIVLRLPFLQIPSEIYVLDQLRLNLDMMDYVLVFGISLIWVTLIGSFGVWKLTRRSILSGLRQEFS
jgi:ABC-type lipoprotein release transport system permease subunit